MVVHRRSRVLATCRLDERHRQGSRQRACIESGALGRADSACRCCQSTLEAVASMGLGSFGTVRVRTGGDAHGIGGGRRPVSSIAPGRLAVACCCLFTTSHDPLAGDSDGIDRLCAGGKRRPGTPCPGPAPPSWCVIPERALVRSGAASGATSVIELGSSLTSA